MSSQPNLLKQITDLYMLLTTARLEREFVVLNGFTHNPMQVYDFRFIRNIFFFFQSTVSYYTLRSAQRSVFLNGSL